MTSRLRIFNSIRPTFHRALARTRHRRIITTRRNNHATISGLINDVVTTVRAMITKRTRHKVRPLPHLLSHVRRAATAINHTQFNRVTHRGTSTLIPTFRRMLNHGSATRVIIRTSHIAPATLHRSISRRRQTNSALRILARHNTNANHTKFTHKGRRRTVRPA